MLTQSPTVPHIQTGEVIGVCGGKVWPMLPDGAECTHLWVAKGGMVGVQLDLAGVRALIDLLREIEEVLSFLADRDDCVKHCHDECNDGKQKSDVV